MENKDINTLKNQLYDFLLKQGSIMLRPIGRYVGVEHPTQKTKKVLIEEIFNILEGKQQPVEQSRKGAPIKNDFASPQILEKIEEYRLAYCSNKPYEEQKVDVCPLVGENSFTVQDSTAGKAISVQDYQKNIVVGQIAFYKNVYCLVPLSGRMKEDELVVLTSALMQSNGLRKGDVLSCYVHKEGRFFLVDKILTVNWIAGPMQRTQFQELSTVYPTELLRFTKLEQSGYASKILDLFVPCGKGQRLLVSSPVTTGHNPFMEEIVNAVADVREPYIYLSLNASPEHVQDLLGVYSEENLLYATYQDSPEFILFLAELALERAKRHAENCEHVCLIVDSFNTLARAYERSLPIAERSPYGLSNKTLAFVKNYFGTAKCLQAGGALTIIGGVSHVGGDLIDPMLARELTTVSNARIVLKNKLFSTDLLVDFSASGVERNLAEESVQTFAEKVKAEYLPRFGEEALYRVLSTHKSEEESVKEILEKLS